MQLSRKLICGTILWATMYLVRGAVAPAPVTSTSPFGLPGSSLGLGGVAVTPGIGSTGLGGFGLSPAVGTSGATTTIPTAGSTGLGGLSGVTSTTPGSAATGMLNPGSIIAPEATTSTGTAGIGSSVTGFNSLPGSFVDLNNLNSTIAAPTPLVPPFGATGPVGTGTISTTTTLPVVTIIPTGTNSAASGLGAGSSFQVTRTGPATNDLTVFFLTGGSATSGQDFQLLSNSVTIPANSTTNFVTLSPNRDLVALDSLTNTLVLQLIPAPTGQMPYLVGFPSNAVATLGQVIANDNNVQAPVRLVVPQNGAQLVAGSDILLAATTSGTNNTTTNVQFFANGTDLGAGSPLTSTGGVSIHGLNWQRVPSGTYDITAAAVDASGTTNFSAPSRISVIPRSGTL